MGIDLTLHNNSFRLRISKTILENQFLIIKAENLKSPAKSSFYFGYKFGLSACFSRCGDDTDFAYYSTNPIKRGSRETVRQVLDTYDLLSRVTQSIMNLDRFVFHAQSFTLQTIGVNDLSGTLYPWFIEKIANLDENNIMCLNHYVKNESASFFRDWYQEKNEPRVLISPDSFEIQVKDCAASLRWINKQDEAPLSAFNSSGAKSPIEQEQSFIAFVYLNSWLRANP